MFLYLTLSVTVHSRDNMYAISTSTAIYTVKAFDKF